MGKTVRRESDQESNTSDLGTSKANQPRIVSAAEIDWMLGRPDEIDAAIFYCPYIPLTENGKPVKLPPVKSRYDMDK
jgi:hypothetical protein